MASFIKYVLMLFCFLSHGKISYSHTTGAYSHDSDIGGNKPGWMIYLRDNVYLSELSLPGTHDSASFYGGDAVATQTISLTKQLQAGIRVFDIRCCNLDLGDLTGNTFDIYHGIIYQGKNLDDVFNEFKSFLFSHVGEAILVRIVLDEESAICNSDNIDLETKFEAYYQRHANYIWTPADTSNFVSIPPLLGDVRGKIVILQDFTSNKKYGLDYTSVNLFDIQDEFHLTTNWDLYTKWDIYVKSKANDARAKITDKTKFDINYLSGSGGSFPYFVASGHSSPGTGAPRLATGLETLFNSASYPDFPRVDCLFSWCTIAFEGTNVLFEHHFGHRDQYTDYVGIIMMDFPGKALIDRIILKNIIYYNCNWECYLNQHSDLQNAFGTDLNSARNHFVEHGQNEARDCQCGNTNSACNWSVYLERYNDLRNVYGFDLNNGKTHYYIHGINENRDCKSYGECNWRCYLNRYQDLQDAYGIDSIYAARSHWYRHGRFEGRNCMC